MSENLDHPRSQIFTKVVPPLDNKVSNSNPSQDQVTDILDDVDILANKKPEQAQGKNNEDSKGDQGVLKVGDLVNNVNKGGPAVQISDFGASLSK